MFSGTPYGDEKFPFEKEIRKIGQDAFDNTINLEGILSSFVIKFREILFIIYVLNYTLNIIFLKININYKN